MEGRLFLRSAFSHVKRSRISPPRIPQTQRACQSSTTLETLREMGIDLEKVAKERGITLPETKPALDENAQKTLENLRLPRSVQAMYLRPLRRSPTHGVPVCDLQLRSYSVRNLELFADMAMRAAYYLNLPARGPVPLPRITERWTVPRSNFIFKKSQENFERITLRRLIQIQDGHVNAVKAWLAFIQKYAYWGVGMKANIWEFEGVGEAGKNMDKEVERLSKELEGSFNLFGKKVEKEGNAEAPQAAAKN